MSENMIFKNNIPYNGITHRNKDISTVGLSMRSVRDGEGNVISESYQKISEIPRNIIDDFIYHNSVYRGKDITDQVLSGNVKTEITNGTFRNMFIGDYFRVSYDDPGYDASNDTEGVGPKKINLKLRIAKFNPYQKYKFSGSNGQEITNEAYRGIVIIPDESISGDELVQWNSTDSISTTTSLNFFNNIYRSKLVKTIQSFGFSIIDKTCIRWSDIDDSVISGSGLKESGVASSFIDKWSFKSSPILMTESEVYGSRIWASSGYAISNPQYPLFKLNPSLISVGYSYWLDSFCSSVHVCAVGSDGRPCVYNPTEKLGFRPCVYIK